MEREGREGRREGREKGLVMRLPVMTEPFDCIDMLPVVSVSVAEVICIVIS